MIKGDELWRRIRMHVRHVMKQYPELYIPYSHLRYRTYRSNQDFELLYSYPVSRDTEIVIEGPPRCGNTFAVAAFNLAQERPIKMAHHLHAAPQVIMAAKMGIPTVVLLREPEEVTVSHVASFPCPVRLALREYIMFYSQILPYRDSFITAKFETVTSNFDAVIQGVNDKFGTTFKLFNHTPENVTRCFQVIDEFYTQKERDGEAKKRKVAFPSKERRRNKEAIRALYHADALTDMRRQAIELYETMAEGSYTF